LEHLTNWPPALPTITRQAWKCSLFLNGLAYLTIVKEWANLLEKFRPIFFWRQNCCIHSSSPFLPPPVLKISFIGYLHILPQRKEKFHFRLTLTTKI
jgi:hypothetical protein